MDVRSALPADAEILAGLLREYLAEGYPGHVGSSATELRRDVLHPASIHYVLIVEHSCGPIGFLAWDVVYDMHWALSGAQVADMYVSPRARGLGAALRLIARACRDVQARGGAFLRGGAYERDSTRRFYSRAAVVAPSGETHLSGRAFRHIAALSDRPARAILADLPRTEWNADA